MPRKIEPASDYRPLHLIDNFQQTRYPEELTARVAVTFGIEDREELAKVLHGAMAAFNTNRDTFDRMPGPAQIKAATRRIAEMSGALAAAIREADTTTLRRIDNCGIETEALCADLLPSLELLHEKAETSLSALPAGKPFGKREKALPQFISNLRKYWTDTLGRKFTRHFHQGEAVSEASRFCVMAAEPLDPRPTPQKINHTMQAVIAEQE